MYNFFNYFLLVYTIVVGAILFWFIFHFYNEKKLFLSNKQFSLDKDDY